MVAERAVISSREERRRGAERFVAPDLAQVPSRTSSRARGFEGAITERTVGSDEEGVRVVMRLGQRFASSQERGETEGGEPRFWTVGDAKASPLALGLRTTSVARNQGVGKEARKLVGNEAGAADRDKQRQKWTTFWDIGPRQGFPLGQTRHGRHARANPSPSGGGRSWECSGGAHESRVCR